MDSHPLNNMPKKMNKKQTAAWMKQLDARRIKALADKAKAIVENKEPAVSSVAAEETKEPISIMEKVEAIISKIPQCQVPTVIHEDDDSDVTEEKDKAVHTPVLSRPIRRPPIPEEMEYADEGEDTKTSGLIVPETQDEVKVGAKRKLQLPPDSDDEQPPFNGLRPIESKESVPVVALDGTDDDADLPAVTPQKPTVPAAPRKPSPVSRAPKTQESSSDDDDDSSSESSENVDEPVGRSKRLCRNWAFCKPKLHVDPLVRHPDTDPVDARTLVSEFRKFYDSEGVMRVKLVTRASLQTDVPFYQYELMLLRLGLFDEDDLSCFTRSHYTHVNAALDARCKTCPDPSCLFYGYQFSTVLLHILSTDIVGECPVDRCPMDNCRQPLTFCSNLFRRPMQGRSKISVTQLHDLNNAFAERNTLFEPRATAFEVVEYCETVFGDSFADLGVEAVLDFLALWRAIIKSNINRITAFIGEAEHFGMYTETNQADQLRKLHQAAVKNLEQYAPEHMEQNRGFCTSMANALITSRIDLARVHLSCNMKGATMQTTAFKLTKSLDHLSGFSVDFETGFSPSKFRELCIDVAWACHSAHVSFLAAFFFYLPDTIMETMRVHGYTRSRYPYTRYVDEVPTLKEHYTIAEQEFSSQITDLQRMTILGSSEVAFLQSEHAKITPDNL